MTSALCLAAVNVMLVWKGSFLYKQDNANYLELDDHLIIRIERIDDIVARVYLVDAHSVQQPIPANVTMARAAGDAVPHFLELTSSSPGLTATPCMSTDRLTWSSTTKSSKRLVVHQMPPAVSYDLAKSTEGELIVETQRCE